MRLAERLGQLALMGVVACGGGNRFGAATGGAAGQAGSGGAGGLGGAGGAAAGGAGSAGVSGGGGVAAGSGSGGAGGAGGMAGSGGTAPTCSCPAGQYCRGTSCRNCSDLSSIEFGPAEVLLDHPTSGLRFPRAGGEDRSLFFTVLAASRSELWYTADPGASASVLLGDGATPSRSALVYLAQPGALGFNVVFDETSDAQRSERSASWDGAVLSGDAALGSPLSPGGFDTYSVAVTQAGRVYWMSTRDGPATLRTGMLGTGTEDVVNIDVPAQAGGGACPRSGDDATPWVTANGSLLLFSSPPVDANCQPVDVDATDLYVVPLSPSSGQPLATAVALAGVNESTDNSSETDPSFSRDLCVLYFASDGGAAQGHDFRLYRAERR